MSEEIKEELKDSAKEQKKEKKKSQEREMTLQEARAYRASLAKPEARKLTEQETREQFRLFWAKEKSKYGKAKDLEEILWIHLKASKHDEPARFDDGLKHFGLKKVK